MRLLFIINTPGQAHTWRYIIEGFLAKGNVVKVLARDDGPTAALLDAFGLPYVLFKPRGTQASRLLSTPFHLEECFRLSKGFNPSMFIGFGLDAAITAQRFRKPCIVFVDDEHTYMQNKLTSLLASAIITPNTFKRTLNKNHIRVNSYKELAYLHPNYFEPDVNIFHELKISPKEKYVVLRFNILDAVHDIGIRGFTSSDRLRLVKELEKYARVFISPEGRLCKELESYRLPVSFNRVHHVLHYAHLLVCDTGTMATEAAVLGTPVVRVLSIVNSGKDPLSFYELNKRYDLLYSFGMLEKGLEKAIDLIKRPGLKVEWAAKRRKLLEEKVDITQFMMNFIENYGKSLNVREVQYASSERW